MSGVRRPVRARPAALLVGLLALLVALGGCVALPESGPVVETGARSRAASAPGYSYVPQPPQPGAPPGEVVRGFLDAMTATPLQTGVARQFLAAEAQNRWNPERSTITYEEVSEPSGVSTVDVRLSGAARFDARGVWQGELSPRRSTLSFPMVVESGEWRIAQAPDALVVPEAWFSQRFRRASLYFFDPTGRILVPEPVFAPRGEQLATTLVRGLVSGPGPALRGVARTVFPSGSEVELSVVVQPGGLAEVALQGDPRSLSQQAAEMVLAQLAWTLRQDPTVRTLRLSIGGEPVTVSGGPSETSVDAAGAYAPTLVTSVSQLFGLREGRVVVASAGVEEDVTGPLGSGEYALRDLAVDLTATQVAGVAADGTAVWVAPLDGSPDDAAAPSVVTWAGADLLRPTWDFAGRLWLVDAGGPRGGGSRISVVADGRRRTLTVPGVTGRRVTHVVVSRDGSRLVTVVEGAARGRDRGDRVMVNRIRYDERGRVLGLTRPVRLGGGAAEPLDVRGIGWRSPTEVVVANALAGELTELRSLPVDGSPASLDPAGTADLLRERILRVIASPVPEEPLFVTTPDGTLDAGMPTSGSVVPDDVRAVTYVG